LLDDHQKHTELLDQAIQAGESFAALLSGDVCDVIWQQTNVLRLEWDQIFAKVTASEQQLEVSLAEWASYTECLSQVEAWLRKMRISVSDDLLLVGSLEDKKAQLQMCKVVLPLQMLHHDLLV